jgi:hypothetical protein
MTNYIDVMKHALGWPDCYRNHYCASEGHHAWAALQEAVEKGFMVEFQPGVRMVSRMWAVTDEGVRHLNEVL